MKKINISLKLSDEEKHALSQKILNGRGLLFVILVGILLIYAFDVIYEKAYIDINFIEYAGVSGPDNTHQEITTLEKIMQNINTRKSNLESIGEKNYRDPFNFPAVSSDTVQVPDNGGSSNVSSEDANKEKADNASDSMPRPKS